MSAIAGLCGPHGTQVDCMDVRRMLDRLAHCGPDGRGIWCDQHVGLGHCMLHTTPESCHETLPLHKPGAALTITCDARIDNRRELTQACGLTGPEREVADSELILAAYQRWGESCVEKLVGDFAFAIWDGNRRQLFCARDALGIRPFFYYHSGEHFIFASEIKALFSNPQVPRSINESRIGDHLAGMFEDRTITFFDGISRLPPAHMLILGPNGAKVQQYWKADPTSEVRASSDAECAEEFLAIFAEAVRCRLRSAFPVGSMLSGGLDSSSIACLARNHLRDGGQSSALHTFSALFRNSPDADERDYINSVLAGGGFVPHFFEGDVNPVAGIPAALDHLDEVPHGPGFILPSMFYAKAKAEGVRVVLDGMGGDEVVANGAPYLGELLRNGSWPEFAQQTSGVAQHANCDHRVLVREYIAPYFSELKSQQQWWTLGKALALLPRQMHDSTPRFVMDYAVQPMARKLSRRLMPKQNGGSSTNGSIINADFAEFIQLDKRRRKLRPVSKAGWPTEREAYCQRINSGPLWMSIEECGRIGAACSVEPRYPELDKRLVEFCVSLPASQKLSQGWSRAVLRRAMDQVLPEDVRWRGDKARFLPPFAHALRRDGRDFLDATILDTPASLAHYFNLPVLRDKYRCFLAGDTSETLAVWRASNLICWLQSVKFPAAVSNEAARVCEAKA